MFTAILYGHPTGYNAGASGEILAAINDQNFATREEARQAGRERWGKASQRRENTVIRTVRVTHPDWAYLAVEEVSS